MDDRQVRTIRVQVFTEYEQGPPKRDIYHVAANTGFATSKKNIDGDPAQPANTHRELVTLQFIHEFEAV